MRVLYVEDDELLGDGFREGLIQQGYTVDWFKDGESADKALSMEPFDIIVLDLGLPKMSGLAVLERLRKRNDHTPVLILTARDTIPDRVKGLDMGADDYLTKPFDLDELCARLRALQRRGGSGSANPLLTFAGIELDPAAHAVTFQGESVTLGRREFTLLHKLIEKPGKVVSRERLTQTLYGWGDDVDSNTLEVHIHSLRKKFGAKTIRTVRGVGYMLVSGIQIGEHRKNSS